MDKQLKDLIDTIEVLKVQKGDAIILKYGERLSEQNYAHIVGSFREILRKMGKVDIPVIILEEGMSIEILRSSGWNKSKRGGPLGNGNHYPSREKIMRNNPAV